MTTSAVIIIHDPVLNEILAAHPTGKPWKNKDGSMATGCFDLIKGGIDPGELPIEAAIRECDEECGIKVTKKDLKYLGKFDYTKEKNLEIFYMEKSGIDVSKLKCESYFEDKNGKLLPEMNGFLMINIETQLHYLYKSLQKPISEALTLI